MEFRIREAIRYLGYGNHAVDEQTKQLIDDSFKELDEIGRERFVYRIFDLDAAGSDGVTVGQFRFESKFLSKNMHGCTKAAIFGATLGIETDLLIQRYLVADVAKAVVVQACAAAKMEELCDRVEAVVSADPETDGYRRHPRFSPGYGDLSLEYQKAILDILEASKKIGLTMTGSCMMSPTKSVTALIGLSLPKNNA